LLLLLVTGASASYGSMMDSTKIIVGWTAVTPSFAGTARSSTTRPRSPGARAEADRSIMGFAEKGADVISRGLPSIVRRAFAAR